MAEDEKPPAAFVPLKSVKGAPIDPAAAVAEIRQIYFRTSKRTIEHDFAHAIELLKSLPDDEARARAHVYMEGLAEMRREWGGEARKRPRRGRPKG
jgi:hypothetical protein